MANTIAELEAKISALEAEKETLATQATELATKLAEAEAKHANLSIEKEAADKTIANLMETTRQLAAAAGEEVSSVVVKEAVVAKLPEPFEMNGKTVTFLKPMFNIDGNDYTAEQAKGLPELIEKVAGIEGQRILEIK
jgi:chromosome segregation ATPase